jgi:sugar lactone lactonase YvrE
MQLLTDAIGMGESPRWHDGRLYVADWTAGTIVAVAPDGTTEVAATVPAPAFCFAFRPDGRWLVVADDRLLVGTPFGPLEPYAPLPGRPGNDIVVDGRGNAYVGLLGFDFGAGEPYPDRAVAPGSLVLVRPDRTVREVAADLAFPNGVAVTADNATLILAESYRGRLVAWDVAADGTLSGRRVWAELGAGTPPDGICLDATGAVWFADVPGHRCVRVAAGGAVLDTVPLDRGAFACALGGGTLFVVANDWGAEGGGRVLTTPAPAPGAGWPG